MNIAQSEKEKFIQQVDKALDAVRPHLAVDGGNVEIADITDEMEVKVRWVGNCEVCSMSAMTMKAGIEQTLKSKFPEISSVTAINGLGF